MACGRWRFMSDHWSVEPSTAPLSAKVTCFRSVGTQLSPTAGSTGQDLVPTAQCVQDEWTSSRRSAVGVRHLLSAGRVIPLRVPGKPRATVVQTMRRRITGTILVERGLCASGPAVHTGPNGSTSAVPRGAPVFAVNFSFRSPRANLLCFLVIGSAIVVIWTWHSLSWHARGIILAVYGLACLGAGLI